jgi:hypothetical protein
MFLMKIRLFIHLQNIFFSVQVFSEWGDNHDINVIFSLARQGLYTITKYACSGQRIRDCEITVLELR